MAIQNFAPAWMTEEHQMLYDSASRFFKEQWAPKDVAWCQAGMMDRQAWEEAGEEPTENNPEEGSSL